jgi:Sec-independent protein translocase protein TatA
MGSFSLWHILIVIAVVAVLFPNLRIVERAGRGLADRIRGWIGRPPSA